MLKAATQGVLAAAYRSQGPFEVEPDPLEPELLPEADALPDPEPLVEPEAPVDRELSPDPEFPLAETLLELFEGAPEAPPLPDALPVEEPPPPFWNRPSPLFVPHARARTLVAAHRTEGRADGYLFIDGLLRAFPPTACDGRDFVMRGRGEALRGRGAPSSRNALPEQWVEVDASVRNSPRHRQSPAARITRSPATTEPRRAGNASNGGGAGKVEWSTEDAFGDYAEGGAVDPFGTSAIEKYGHTTLERRAKGPIAEVGSVRQDWLAGTAMPP
jgi:hypothetical protein